MGGGGCNPLEDDFVTDLWVASPAGAKERKQPTPGLVPLAGSEWERGNGSTARGFVQQLSQFPFPQQR